MFVPFGTHVVDRNGNTVGTVSRLVLHPQTREVVALVVQQGLLDRRKVVIPLNKVAAFGDEVRLVLSASELASVDLYDSHALRPMPDHWPMPAGFDLRSFFLVAGDPWTESVLPFRVDLAECLGRARLHSRRRRVGSGPRASVAPDHARARAEGAALSRRDGHPGGRDRVSRRRSNHAERQGGRREEAQTGGTIGDVSRTIGHSAGATVSGRRSST